MSINWPWGAIPPRTTRVSASVVHGARAPATPTVAVDPRFRGPPRSPSLRADPSRPVTSQFLLGMIRYAIDNNGTTNEDYVKLTPRAVLIVDKFSLQRDYSLDHDQPRAEYFSQLGLRGRS